MNNNTKNNLCIVEKCESTSHSKGLCRRHYRLQNIKYCNVKGCNNIRYARNYCSKHYRIHYRKKKCGVENCNVPVNTRGYCTKHYRRFMKHGDTSVVKSKKVVGVCKVEGCKKDIDSLGYCTKHYQRFNKYGDPLFVIRNRDVPELCTIKGCGNKYYASGYCSKHYTRYRRYGDPSVLKVSPNVISDGCKISGCNKVHFGKGYCKHHYYRSDYHKQKSQKRRASSNNAPFNDFDKAMMPAIKREFNNTCAYCGKKLEECHIEHVIPLSRGGSHSINNIVISCPSCNYKKNTKTLEEWYPNQPFYSREREDKILKWMGYKMKDNKIQMQLF